MIINKEKITILDRKITKEELDKIYKDFKKIEKSDGIQDANTNRYEYIAEDNNEIIGIASGLTYHKWFYLSDLWIHENYRRNGLGTKLLSMLEDKIKTIGIKHIYTWTSGFINPKFYEKQVIKYLQFLKISMRLKDIIK